MRYPVFGHTVNPAIDRPILRKSLSHVLSLVEDGLARWIDVERKHLGVQLRGRFLQTRDEAWLHRAAGSGFDTAWHIRESHYPGSGGPLVWQLKSAR